MPTMVEVHALRVLLEHMGLHLDWILHALRVQMPVRDHTARPVHVAAQTLGQGVCGALTLEHMTTIQQTEDMRLPAL